MLKSVSLLSLSNVPCVLCTGGLWLLDFTSQFAPDSPVKAPLFPLFAFVVTVKRRRGPTRERMWDRDRHAPPIDSQKW